MSGVCYFWKRHHSLQRLVTHNHCKLYMISYLFVYLFTVCLDLSLINEAKNNF